MISQNIYLKSGPAIFLASIFLLIYIVLLQYTITFPIALFFFFLSPFVLLYMVFCVLKDNKGLSGRTFDQYFYEDSDYRRTGSWQWFLSDLLGIKHNDSDLSLSIKG